MVSGQWSAGGRAGAPGPPGPGGPSVFARISGPPGSEGRDALVTEHEDEVVVHADGSCEIRCGDIRGKEAAGGVEEADVVHVNDPVTSDVFVPGVDDRVVLTDR